MSDRGNPGEKTLLRRGLRFLFRGPIGEDVVRDIEGEHNWRRARHGPGLAALWLLAQLLHPTTWSLARALRRGAPGISGRTPWMSRPGGLGVSWLDVKLGLRMLVKYPVMTVVSGLAISVTITVGIATFALFQSMLMRPTVPLAEGERIVSLGLLNTQTGRSDWHLLHDFEVWRRELTTVEDLSIWRADARNIVAADGHGELAPFAMMSASGFEVTGVPPLLGRHLLASDEVSGAPPVVVLGHPEWVTRFEGDPEIVGTQIQIDRSFHTIVGVMPEGFTFPVAHRLWLPFQDDPDEYELLAGPTYYVFGRLAPGVSAAEAQAQLTVVASQRAKVLPDTHGHLRAQIMSYTDPHTGMDNAAPGALLLPRAVLAVLTLLVLIPFANVAILVYARTATRAGEIALRTAIGASRRRVVLQLFVEALVLSAAAAGAGVALALFAQGRIEYFLEVFLSASLPFWATTALDPWALAYTAGLTVLAAVVAGVVPGLQATGRSVQANLQAAGRHGMRLGRVWTGLVVAQVAITVAFLPLAGSVARQALRISVAPPSFVAEEYLGAMVSGSAARALGDREAGADADRLETIEEVLRRVEADPRVSGATLATRNPGDAFTANIRVDVEGIGPHPSGRGYPVGATSTRENFFDVLGIPIESGRRFGAADVDAEVPPAIVDQTFVETVLGGANPLGRRIREHRAGDAEPAPWREIVGMSADLIDNPMSRDEVGGMVFSPLSQGQTADGIRMIVHVPSSPDRFVPEVQRIATEVDPTLPVSMVMTLDSMGDPLTMFMLGVAIALGLILLSVLLLCSAGVFSLMSFNVTQRRREIAIRSALGGAPSRLLTHVMARSARQLGVGVLVGLIAIAAIPDLNLDGLLVEIDSQLIVAVAGLMVLVGLIAAAGPARAGLRVQPTEALKDS